MIRKCSILFTITFLVANISGMMPPKITAVTVSSLMELVGFSPACVSLALAQCYRSNEEDEPGHLDPYYTSYLNHLLQNLTQTLQDLRVDPELKDVSGIKRPRNCRDLQAMGIRESGERWVYPYRCCPDWGVKVVCDHGRDGGGWTLIQRRNNIQPRMDFYRTWVEYERGFGHPSTEFWLGLDAIHELTTSSLQELLIDLWDCEGRMRWAKYGFFHVGDATTKYVMHCGRHSGNAGDSLSYHSGRGFTTHDNDNDGYTANCAKMYEGGWWYQKCHDSNLNGRYLQGVTNQTSKGITWSTWTGLDYSLCQVEMKIRPAFT